MFDNQLRNILLNIQTIAIVGAVDKVGRPVDRVAKYLMERGFTIFPIHPVRKNVWGLQTFKSIAELAEYLKDKEINLDILCLFRASEYCYEHALETIESKIHPSIFWLQEGIVNKQAGEYIHSHNIKYIEDRCIKTEYKRLLPHEFYCIQCGICCSGKNGIVVDNKTDLPRLLKYFDISLDELDKKYTYIHNNKRVLRSSNDNYCIFYDDVKSCLIHKARPDICRAWPYFRGNIVDSISFEMAKSDCKGILKTSKHANFQKEAIEYLNNNNLIKEIDDTSAANALKIKH